MSYSDFLNNLISPITAFVDWLSTMANSLINNYYFITFLGITLFISLFWFLFNLIFNYFDNIQKRYDDYNDKYYNYELLKEVQSSYLNNHYPDEYDLRYRNKVLNSQVLNGYLQNNEQLDIDNRILSNKNRMEALKSIKSDLLDDNDDSNDSDIDLIVPPKKVELANVKELKKGKGLFDEYPNLPYELEKNNNQMIDDISKEYTKYIQSNYIPDDNPFILYNPTTNQDINRFVYTGNQYNMYDIYTGEVIPESRVLEQLQHYHESLEEDYNDSQGNYL